jgi:hypothetical protein
MFSVFAAHTMTSPVAYVASELTQDGAIQHALDLLADGNKFASVIEFETSKVCWESLPDMGIDPYAPSPTTMYRRPIMQG